MDTTAAQQQVFLGAFIVALGSYWMIFPIAERVVKLMQPEWYEKHKTGELRYKVLFPVIIYLIRAVNGSLIVVPSCVKAAAETPWELGQTMTTAGHVCVISQVVPWASELLIMYETSTELYLHHVICTIAYFNIVAAPNAHMIKPLYVHTASQLGDVCIAFHKIMRNFGYRPNSCRLLYINKLVQIATTFTFKISFVFYAMGRTILTPDGMWDLVRAIGLLFLACYSIRTQVVSFFYTKIAIQPAKGPAGLLFQRSGVFISRFHIGLTASAAAAIVSKVLLYAASLKHPMGAQEHAQVWIESITSVLALYLLISLSMMLWKRFLNGDQVLAEGWYRSVKRGELYLRFGALLTALMIHGRNTGSLMARKVGLSSQTLSIATAFTYLGWDLFVRIAIWMSVGEEARGLEQKDESSDLKGEKNPPPQKASRAASDHAVAARQLRMIWADVVILAAGLFLPNGFTTLEKNYTLFLTHALVQVLDESMSVSGKGGIRNLTIAGNPHSFASLKLVLAVGQSLVAFCAVRRQEMLWASVAITLFSRLSSYVVIPPKKDISAGGVKSLPQTLSPPGPPTLRRRILRVLKTIFTSPEVYSVMVITAIEVMSLLELMKGQQQKRQTTAGFENVREVLASPMGVVSNLITMTLVITSVVLPSA